MMAHRAASDAVNDADLLTTCTVPFGNTTKEFSWGVSTSKSFIFARGREKALDSLEAIPHGLMHPQLSTLSL